ERACLSAPRRRAAPGAAHNRTMATGPRVQPEDTERETAQRSRTRKAPLRRATLVPQRSVRPSDDPFSESASEVVKSSARVLDLLEFFRETRQPARATEISRALGLS